MNKEIIGQTFTRLYVIKRTDKNTWKNPNYPEYLCKCECGNEVVVQKRFLLNGHKKSCGCLQKETRANNSRKAAGSGKTKKSIDITGKRFGRWTVLYKSTKTYSQPNGTEYALWHCRCDCGTERDILSANLRDGKTKSCGCYLSDKMKGRPNNYKTGHSGTRLYKIWDGMKYRCFYKSSKIYKYYGERGIRICDEWLGDEGFANFEKWAIENGYSDGLSIDRINPNGNYEPSNCRWATATEQNNNKRNQRFITIDGETKTMAEWCDQYSLPKNKYGYTDAKFIKLIQDTRNTEPKTNPC